MKRNLLLVSILALSISFASVAFAVSLPGGEANFETSLQTRISTSDTSMTLVSNSLKGGGALTGYHCFTLDEGRTDAEFICGSIAGTSVTGLERGVSYVNGTTTVASIQYAHRVGADVKVTDYPLIERILSVLTGKESLAALINYVSGTGCVGTEPNNTICDKHYIDTVGSAGAANANETTKGISELATQIEMASSTALGSTGASLVLQAKYSTSSPYTAGIWNVITQNDGKINPNFIATSSAYTYNWATINTFTGSTTFSAATTTLAATTTIAASASNKLVLNGIPYAFPSAQNASSTYLATNGSGLLTWEIPQLSTVTNNLNVALSTTGTGTTSITTLSIPAGTVKTNTMLEIRSIWSAVNENTTSCEVEMDIGTSPISYIKMIGDNKGMTDATIFGINSSSQYIYSINNGNGVTTMATSTTYNMANAQTITFFGKNNAGAGGSCLMQGYVVTLTSN